MGCSSHEWLFIPVDTFATLPSYVTHVNVIYGTCGLYYVVDTTETFKISGMSDLKGASLAVGIKTISLKLFIPSLGMGFGCTICLDFLNG